VDPPSGGAELGRPTEVIDHDPQVGSPRARRVTALSWSLVASMVATRSWRAIVVKCSITLGCSTSGDPYRAACSPAPSLTLTLRPRESPEDGRGGRRTVRGGVAEAQDPGDEPALLLLSPHPLRRPDGVRGARVRPRECRARRTPRSHAGSRRAYRRRAASRSCRSGRAQALRSVSQNTGLARWSHSWTLQWTIAPSVDTAEVLRSPPPD
jgi:hypothetical protein